MCSHLCLPALLCHYCDHAVLLLWSSCPVDVQQSFTKPASFYLNTPVITGISGKWLNENTKDWFSCGYEYYFIDWELSWLNISSFHTLNYFMMLKVLSLSGQGWFDYRIKDTSGNSGRLYFHGCGPLEQHGKQCHRDCFLLNLIQIPGSSPARGRLSVAKRQGKEEYKNYPMTAILSCAGRLLLNNAKCPTSKTNLTLLLLSTKNFLERFSN